jgi:hypothetical protein
MTGEDIQSIAGDQNQQLPTSPMQAAVLGASPDSAKMIGDARQKRAALDINQQAAPQTETLSDRLRTRQAGDTAVATRGQLPVSENLAKLGGLGDRVQSAIQGAMNRSLAQAPVITSTPDISTALADYNSNPTPAAVEAFRAKSGGLSPQEYMQQQSAESTASTQLAAATPDQIGIAELNLVGEGQPFTSNTELAAALGISETELGNMNLSQLQSNIQSQVDKNTQDMEQWTSRATDPNLGPAERAEARQQLRDMGAIGVRANEEQWNQLGDAIDSADEVQFGGQSYTVDELLSDDGITGLVSDYLNNPARASELSKSEPELTKWIESHRAALQDSVEQLQDTDTAYQETTSANQAIAQGLPDDTMAALLPGWDPSSATPIDLASAPPAVKLLNDPATGATLTGVLNQYPELASELAGMDESQIRLSGILDPTSEKWQSYISTRNSYNAVNNTSSIEELIDQVFGTDVDQTDVDAALKRAYRESRTGLGDPYADNPALSMLDPDRDGAIGSKRDTDTLGVVKAGILGKNGFNLSENSPPKLGHEGNNPMESLKSTITPTVSTFSRLSDILGKGLLDSKGKHLDLDSKDMEKLTKKATIADLLELQSRGAGEGNVLGIDKKEKKQLSAAIEDRINSELSSMYKQVKYKPSSISKLSSKELSAARMNIEDLISTAKSDGKKYLVAELKKQLDDIDSASDKINKKSGDKKYKLSSDEKAEPPIPTGASSVSTKQLSKKEQGKLNKYQLESSGDVPNEDITGFVPITDAVDITTDSNYMADIPSSGSSNSGNKSNKSDGKNKSSTKSGNGKSSSGNSKKSSKSSSKKK